MGLFDTIRSTISNLQNTAQEYIDMQLRLLKIQAAEKISSLLASIIASIIVSLFLLFFLLLSSIGLAHLLGDWIGRLYAGYMIVAALYLLAGVIVFKNKERILKRPILDSIIKQLFAEKKPPPDNR